MALTFLLGHASSSSNDITSKIVLITAQLISNSARSSHVAQVFQAWLLKQLFWLAFLLFCDLPPSKYVIYIGTNLLTSVLRHLGFLKWQIKRKILIWEAAMFASLYTGAAASLGCWKAVLIGCWPANQNSVITCLATQAQTLISTSGILNL